jgi:polysaccharide export outer membrane protein
MQLRCLFRFALAMAGAVSVPVYVASSSTERAYRIGVGDLVAVEAFQHEEVSGEFTVEENGAITFPLLGTVQVAGKTTAEVADLLERALEKDYYVDVQLQVEVREYRSQPVTVLGEVQRPGTYYLEGRTTVTQLLADAGGLKESAGPTLELRRVATVDGVSVQKVMTFATRKLLTGEEGRDVEVRQGDVLSVSAKQLYFITGEIARPGQYEIAPGMTLMQAISQAGGQGKFASQMVELHREESGAKEILTFDLSQIRKGKAQDPSVQSGDVIIVRRRFF